MLPSNALMVWPLARGAAAAAAAIVAVVELAHRRASRHPGSYGAPRPDATSEALIVLGYGSRPGTVNAVQRWRCEIAVRSRSAGRASTVVFSGRGPSVEAEARVMAAHAQDVLGLPATAVVLEKMSNSTWENIALSLPLVEHAEVIKIVSDPMHARRGRTYAQALRPDLAERLAPADDYRFLERWWLKAACAAYDVYRRTREAIRQSQP